MSLGDREIAAFNVEVSQEIADELHATLAESNALVFGQIGQPGSVLTLGRKRSSATVCASHLIRGRGQRRTAGAACRHQRLHRCDQEAPVAAGGGE